MTILPTIATITMFIFFIPPSSEDDRYYSTCSRAFKCGSLEILYPFWSGSHRPRYCGLPGFELSCTNKTASININAVTYRIRAIDPATFNVRMYRVDLWEDICHPNFVSTTFNSIFSRRHDSQNISFFYACPTDIDLPKPYNFSCNESNGSRSANFFGESGFLTAQLHNLSKCRHRVDAMLRTETLTSLYIGAVRDALKEGFNVRYEDTYNQTCLACRASGGICGSDPNLPLRHVCHCPIGTLPRVCPSSAAGKKRDWGLKTGIGVVAVLFGMILACLVFFVYHRRKKKQYVVSTLLPRMDTSPKMDSDSEKPVGTYVGVRIFTYEELEQATNNFDSSQEIGDGGFGTVYHGELRDGRHVAVKRLYENNYRRLEQFMNEVEILTRLRHEHLVSLYGCTSRRSRELLLVYEYVPNGTVADHLHGARSSPPLTWPVRVSVALQTASALSYLHLSDIIHRDVKTDNILLDDSFFVKVADFGLSRLFPPDATHVSTAPQGTPGYVDPDYHQCYRLTSKSDVYSFGVVLMELVSSKPAVDISRRKAEINLSSMAVDRILNNTLHEIVDPNLGFCNGGRARRTIESVAELAFRCLQGDKELRPSMEEVLECLKCVKREICGDDKLTSSEKIPNSPGKILNSPDSVTVKWASSSTTPNASS